MAPTTGLLAFFTQVDNQGGVIVREPPKLDLDLYIQSYRGRTRYDRLFLIGRSSVTLCVEALKAAIQEAKAGKDVQRYVDAWECLRLAAPGEPEATFDSKWAESTQQANKRETARLENELKGYKNNLIKESIRMGNEDLGKHFEAIGDLSSAAEAFGRMRSDVSTSKHILEVGKHLVNVSIQRREWSMVIANLNKITGVHNGENTPALVAYTDIVKGLCNLGVDKYDDAAKCFVQVDAQVPATEYNDIVNSNDIAIYGGLLALATMDRPTLQASVLDNQNFRTFLELEPHIRKAISLFVNGRYSACLSILESYRADYLLDIWLQKHVAAIYSQIRSKCIVQYFIPFSCVTLDSLNSQFAPPGETVEEELATMIKNGALQARLNTIDRLLTAVSPNDRTAMALAGLEAARNYEKEALERVRRMNLAAADLEVRGPKRAGGPHSSMVINDKWYDDTVRSGQGQTTDEARAVIAGVSQEAA